MQRLSTKAMMDQFISGVHENGKLIIRPLRLVSSKDLKRADQQYFSKAQSIYNAILNNYSQLNNIDGINLEVVSLLEWDKIYNDGFKCIADSIGHKKRKLDELSYVYVYGKLMRHNSADSQDASDSEDE